MSGLWEAGDVNRKDQVGEGWIKKKVTEIGRHLGGYVETQCRVNLLENMRMTLVRTHNNV